MRLSLSPREGAVSSLVFLPQILAKKVYTLYSLAVQQLSRQDHYDFGLRALTSLLRYAGRKRRVQPDMSDEEVDCDTALGLRPPESLVLPAGTDVFQLLSPDWDPPAAYPLCHLSPASPVPCVASLCRLHCSCPLPLNPLDRKGGQEGAQGPLLRPEAPSFPGQVLLLSMRDMNIAKLTSVDVPLFNAIVQDLFPNVELPTIDYGKVLALAPPPTSPVHLWTRRLASGPRPAVHGL